MKAKTQIKCPQSALHFVNDQELTPEFEEDLVNFCFYFIANVVNFMTQSKDQSDGGQQDEKIVFFVVIDNASTMDLGSWKLL